MHRDLHILIPSLVLALTACGGGERPGAGGAGTDTTGAAPAAPRTSGELAYVTNEGSGEVTVLDVTTDSVIATILVGTRPRGARVTPDGRTLFVALSGSPRCPPTMSDEECEKLKADKTKDGIGEIDIAARKVVRVLPGGSDPETFDISKDGTRLFVSNEDANAATFVDIASGKVIKTVTVGREPEGVELHPDGKTVWVTGETDHDVSVLDTESGKVLTRIVTDNRPRALVFSSDGSRAYVSCEVGGTVNIIDARAYKVLKKLRMPDGSKPMGLAISPDDRRLYVGNGRGGTVSAVDLGSDSVVATVKVGTRPWGIGLTSDGRKLYTANGPSNDVTVLDTETMQVVRKLPAGELPWGVVVGTAP